MTLLSKKQMNMAYGLGAAVVIIGALFKLEHWDGASYLLIIGLVTEALIFGLSAFDNVEEEEPRKVAILEAPIEDTHGMLSKKLDAMLKEAKIDGELMVSLGNSIKNFEGAAKSIMPTADSIASNKKYSEELTLAASQMESLNGLYKIQLQSAARNAQINDEVAENNIKLKEQMHSLTTNLSSLNNVYGGMLSAMSNKG